MMLKLVGAAAILGSSYMMARNLHKNMSDRKTELEEIIVMLESMKSNSVNNNNIAESIKESLSEVKFRTKHIFEEFTLLMEEKQHTDCCSAWESVKRDMYPLVQKDIVILDSFFKKSNDISVSSFLEKTDEVIKRLSDNLNEIKENADKNKKVYYNSCICIGILTVILLI